MSFRLNVPPFTRSMLITLTVSTTLNTVLRPRGNWRDGIAQPVTAIGDGNRYLCVIPELAPYYPWVFMLATFVEQNVFGLLITGLTVLYGGRYLERAWGQKEFGKFILFVSMIPNLISFFLYFIFFIVSGSTSARRTTISGGIAIQAGFLVSFKQLVPEHTVSIAKGIIKMRVKHFPAVFLLANTLSGVLFGTETAMFLAWFGFMTSWVYLRFYRISPSLSSAATGDGSVIKGDASDTFAFSHFFPEPLQTPIGIFADNIYNLLITVKILKPFSAEDVDAGNEQASARAEGGLPSLMNSAGRGGRGGGSRAEAERRRALALKALDQRLHAAAGRPVQQQVPAAAQGASMLGETSYETDRSDGPSPGESARS